MSKRARITLSADIDQEPDRETEAATGEQQPDDAHGDFATADKEPVDPGAAVSRMFGSETLVKAVFVGLAAVAIALLWRIRRP
jgi:hypothetical protein